jgi:LSD1 subclass zinc finger protein
MTGLDTTPVDQLEADYLIDKCNRIGCENVADWSLLLSCADVLGVCSTCRPHTLDWLREHPIVKCALCHTDSLFARDFVWERRR